MEKFIIQGVIRNRKGGRLYCAERKFIKMSILRASWYLLTPLVLAICIGAGQATGQTQALPGGRTSGGNPGASKKSTVMPGFFKGKVVQVIDAGRYAYLQIETGTKRVWVAVPAFDGKPGDAVLVPPGVPVADFHSKRLNRRFKMIYFVGGVRRVDAKPTE